MENGMKCIIDTDPGADDVLALIMALNSPTLDILALTTVEGNARLEHTTANALRLLAYMGRGEIPVYAGSDTPLVGEFHHAYEVHGDEGLTVRLPDTDLRPADGNAVGYIVDTVMSSPDEITLFALGPLTNVARALQREERLKDALRRIYIMGGQGDGPGNVTPYAEFNIWDDPHAANVVFASGAPRNLARLGHIAPNLDTSGRWFVAERRIAGRAACGARACELVRAGRSGASGKVQHARPGYDNGGVASGSDYHARGCADGGDGRRASGRGRRRLRCGRQRGCGGGCGSGRSVGVLCGGCW